MFGRVTLPIHGQKKIRYQFGADNGFFFLDD
jgi:hypothetical protein